MTKILPKLPALLLAFVLSLVFSASAFASATVVIQNNDTAGVGFNDPTPATPIGGNNGTTVGQQRLNAFQFAADIWGATLPGGGVITVRASWMHLECTSNSAVLGSASTTTLHRNFLNAPYPNTWYPAALANVLSGTDTNAGTAEISARFNFDIGTTGCLESKPWYYGLDNNHGSGRVNLVNVVLHELGHGLGFASYTDEETGKLFTGSNGVSAPSIYDRFLLDNTTGKHWPDMTDAERMASAINTTGGISNLVWDGAQVISDGTFLANGKDASGRPRLYTPNPVNAGSSVSHWDTSASPNQLMEPFINTNLTPTVTVDTANKDLTFSLLKDIGWCPTCPLPPPPPPPTPTGPPPANDNFANAQSIAGCTGSVTGTTNSATHETGEPSHDPGGTLGGGSAWYQWQAPSSGNVTINTTGAATNYDTVLAVYTGNSVSNLGTPVARNDDIDPGKITTSTVTFLATAGVTYKIAVDGYGGEAGNFVLNWAQSGCTATKTNQSITFLALPIKTFGDADFTVNATASSGLGVSYSATGSCTVTGNSVHITGAGFCTITASQPGNSSFNAAVDVSQAFTINKANQTIAFGALSNKTYGDAPFTVSASASSGLTVSYSIVSGLAATISGNTVTIKGLGTVTVRASQAGDANRNAAFVDQSFAVVSPSTVNPIDQNDLFVRNHYLDFLDREPETEGFTYWTNILLGCGTDASCLNRVRVEISSRFFIELEFQRTGFFVMRLYRASFGTAPTYPQFIADRPQVVNSTAGQLAFANIWVNRAAFIAEYPTNLTPAEFVQKLYDKAGVADTTARAAAVTGLTNNTKTRADVIFDLVELASFQTREYNPAFVRMQYFGYLRREVEQSGYDYWMNVLTNLSPNNYQAMICAFVNSNEYQLRFNSTRGRFTELDCASFF